MIARLAALCLLLWPGLRALAAPGAVRAIHVAGQDCWAAGDRSLLLHSADGGKTWRAVHSPTAADFQFISRHKRTVYFYGGRAVSGHPDAAAAVIVRFREGSDAPRPFRAPPHGWLYGGAIAGEGGVAFGQAHAEAPGGIWRTLTGGRVWNPLPVGSEGFLRRAAFRTPYYGYVFGRRLRILSVRRFAEPRVHPPEDDADLCLRAGAFLGEERCWAVGDTGTVLASRPTGQRWRQVDVRLPFGTRRLADFEAIVVAPRGRSSSRPARAGEEQDGRLRTWIAGGLLGIVLYTDDGGRTWQHLPAPGVVHALAHVEDDVLLAGGNAGTIWRSGDAGKTWRRVCGTGKTDVLFVLAAMDRSAYPAIVAHALAGLSVGVVYVTRPSGSVLTPPGQPLRAAAAAAGASGVTVLNDFPSLAAADPQRPISDRDVLAHWSAVLDTPAEPILRQQVAAAIRLYRPAVLAVGPSDAGPTGPRAENRLVARVALRAADPSAKDDAYKELAAAGLKPWRVQRVFAGRERNESWRPPWEKADLPERGPGRCVIDGSLFPAGSRTTLEMLSLRAVWRLPWYGARDRPGRLTAYRCRQTSRPLRLFTAGLLGNRLPLRTPSAVERDLAAGASIRFAAATGRIRTAMQRLVQAADATDRCDLAADRMLLVYLKLLEDGRLVESESVFARFLQHGAAHPLRERLEVAALARAYSAEWQAQFRRLAHPAPRTPAQIQAHIRRLAALAPWAATAGGRMLAARMLAAGGRGPDAAQMLKRIAQGRYGDSWQVAAQWELSQSRGAAGADDTRGPPRRRPLPGPDSVQPPARLAIARPVAKTGTFDGLLREPFWRDVPAYGLRDASGEPAPPSHAGSVQVIRTPADHLVFGVRLPAAGGRTWNVTLALDADRDAWTQLVFRWSNAGTRSAWLITRNSPPAALGKGTFSLRGRPDGDDDTFEAGLAIALPGQDPRRPGLWRFQLLAEARDPGRTTMLYFQQQPDRALLSHRYGLLRVPVKR